MCAGGEEAAQPQATARLTTPRKTLVMPWDTNITRTAKISQLTRAQRDQPLLRTSIWHGQSSGQWRQLRSTSCYTAASTGQQLGSSSQQPSTQTLGTSSQQGLTLVVFGQIMKGRKNNTRMDAAAASRQRA